MSQLVTNETKRLRKMLEDRRSKPTVKRVKQPKVIHPDSFRPLNNPPATKRTRHDGYYSLLLSAKKSIEQNDSAPVEKEHKTNGDLSEKILLECLPDTISLQATVSLHKNFSGKKKYHNYSEPQPDDNISSLLQPAPSCSFVDQLTAIVPVNLCNEYTFRQNNMHRAILRSARTGNLEYIEKYLSIENVSSYLTDLACKGSENGETPLAISSMNGHLNVVRFFTEKVKVDLNQFGNIRNVGKQGNRPIVGTALHAAVVAGHLHIVTYLAEVIGQANINEVTDDGFTALHLAAIHLTGEIQHAIVNCLLFHGAVHCTTDCCAGKPCWELTSGVMDLKKYK